MEPATFILCYASLWREGNGAEDTTTTAAIPWELRPASGKVSLPFTTTTVGAGCSMQHACRGDVKMARAEIWRRIGGKISSAAKRARQTPTKEIEMIGDDTTSHQLLHRNNVI